MRYLEILFPVTDTEDDSVYQQLVPHAPRRSATLFNFEILDDGTTIELVQVEGDRAEIEAELEHRENLLSYSIFGSAGASHYIYQHVDQNHLLIGLLQILRVHRVIVDLPIRYGPTGVTIRVVGEEAAIQTVFDAIPQDVRDELEVERIGEYVPGPSDLRARLTDRQREVLEVAVANGYYAFPRRSTVEDLAVELGISQSTASEHLRRIEASVLQELV